MRPGPDRAAATWWSAVLAATLLVAGPLVLVGAPSPLLFAALAVGLVAALLPQPRPGTQLPPALGRASQALIGVLAGALVAPSALSALAGDWLPVLAATLVTLLVSLGAGLLLGRHPEVDDVTGSFALVAGGASGLTAMSHELGADQRVVAVVQYLRVLLIVASVPLAVALLPSGHAGGAVAAGPGQPWWTGAGLTALCVVVGAPLARLIRLPAATLLGPMLTAAVLSGTGLLTVTVPGALVQAAFAGIGLQVGLSFTRESLRSVRRILPLATALIIGMIVVTAAVGIPLLALTGASVQDGYLATSPGGIYVVLAAAADTGADTTLVLTVQVLRVLVMLLAAPGLAVLLSRRSQARRRQAGD